jgi:hypothetical protein
MARKMTPKERRLREALDAEDYRPCCGTCPFWDDMEIEENMHVNPNDVTWQGICRRHAPVSQPVYPITLATLTVHFPRTYKDDWCGDHPEISEWLERNPPEREWEGYPQPRLRPEERGEQTGKGPSGG